MKTKRILAMTIACALLTGSAFAAPLPQPDPDDPALGNFTITDESEGGQAKYSFTKAAEMVTAAQPFVGMLWLMVSIFAPEPAKIERTLLSTPGLSLSRA